MIKQEASSTESESVNCSNVLRKSASSTEVGGNVGIPIKVKSDLKVSQ